MIRGRWVVWNGLPLISCLHIRPTFGCGGRRNASAVMLACPATKTWRNRGGNRLAVGPGVSGIYRVIFPTDQLAQVSRPNKLAATLPNSLVGRAVGLLKTL